MNPAGQARTPQQQVLVLWIIWFANLSGMVIILSFAAGGWPSGEDKGFSFANPFFLIPFGAFLGSVVVRVLILPRQTEIVKQLPVAIVGMALAEAAVLVAAFVLPPDAVTAKQTLIVLGFLGVLSYIPFYAGRKNPRDRHGFSASGGDGGGNGYQR